MFVNEKLPKYMNIIFSVFFFILVVIFSSNCGIYYDDFIECCPNDNEKIFDSLLPSETINGGGYTTIFFTKLVTFFIPFMLNIHPEDFQSQYFSIVKGLLFVIVFYFSSKIFLLGKKYKYYFSSVFLFLGLFILYYAYRFNLMCIDCNEVFFRYLISLFCYYIFYWYLFKFIVFKNYRINNLKIILLIFSVIQLSTNLETMIFSTMLFLFFVIAYNFLLRSIQFLKNINVNKYKFNLNFRFYSIALFFFITAVVYLLSPRFMDNFDGRGFGSFDFSICQLLDFFYKFYIIYILQNALNWAVLISLIVYNFRTQSSSLAFKKNIFTIFIVISIVMVYFSFILFGKNSYTSGFWIGDPKLLAFFKFMLLFPTFLLLNSTLKSLKINYRKLFIKLLTLFLVVLSFNFCVLFYGLKDTKTTAYTYKRINYINEKMYRFFYLKNKTPYLLKVNPVPSEKEWIPFPFLEILGKVPTYNTDSVVCSSDSTHTSVYISKIYKVPSVVFCMTDDAYDRFLKLGGNISKSELENVKFEKLKNADFVLNSSSSSENNLTSDEVIKIFRTFY